MNEFLDIFMEAGVDTLKLIPFLFLTYILMEWLEHRTGSHTQAAILRAGKAGPVFGGILGIVPQCGFSAAASNLYSGGLITAGALVAVFLSTSDEMLPIFISEAVPAWTIIKILDFLYHSIWGRKMRYRNIHTMCESEHCKCDDEGIFFSALRHTIHITIFLFLITLVLEAVIDGVGEEALAGSSGFRRDFGGGNWHGSKLCVVRSHYSALFTESHWRRPDDGRIIYQCRCRRTCFVPHEPQTRKTKRRYFVLFICGGGCWRNFD